MSSMAINPLISPWCLVETPIGNFLTCRYCNQEYAFHLDVRDAHPTYCPWVEAYNAQGLEETTRQDMARAAHLGGRIATKD
jgi:hypothetical protein